jgi:hypothetical protein
MKTRNIGISIMCSKGKGKAISLQALTGPEVSRRLRLPACQPYAPAAFTTRKYSW